MLALQARADEKIGWSVPQKPADVLVILKAEADLRPTILMTSPEARRAFIVAELRRTAEASQAPLLLYLNGLPIQTFSILNAIRIAHASPELVETLSKRDDVKRIIADVEIPMARPIAERAAGHASSNIAATGAEAVWAEGFEGQDIVVAGQDTGVDATHPALAANFRGDWHDAIHADQASVRSNKCGYDLAKPCDDVDHGTHTLGTMAGTQEGIGMAPKSKWIACRNMNGGYGKPSTYLECYEWMLNLPHPPDIINNSWGCDIYQGCEGHELIPVLKAIHDAGIMNVVSAGNSGPKCDTVTTEPATISDYGLTVGAYDHTSNEIARFSSRGPSALTGALAPDLVAPGVEIRSSVPGGGYSDVNFSGTSMAGPHVAGAVALLWSAQPKLKGQVDQTIALLRETATPMKDPNHNCGSALGFQTPNNTYGYGLLNIKAAVDKARQL